ncbi:MAG: alanine racemase [Steroidobacteraceae bacterium]|jgi:alanine racemase|nr:alanine racemase [Steroidobacteraceae bacterium]
MNPTIRAVIDTAALRHNLGRVRELAPRSKVLAVIKANAYGHGSVPSAVALAGADGFAVARLEEAVALRAAGLRHRIVLLEGVFGTDGLRQAAHHRLDLCVHEPEQLAMLDAWRGDHEFSVWVKVDTGMNRLGFKPAQFPRALSRLSACAAVAKPLTLVTHLANADDRDDATTREQLDLFGRLTAGVPGERSIANSAGTLGWEASRADWVRPGLMLYGVSPFSDTTGQGLGLRPAMRLETTVIAVKDVEAGERVGYGGAWTAPRRSRLAVAAAGYGDGYPRNTPSGTPVLVNEQRAELVGRVSMDMITIDVTHLPRVLVGDVVVLWGGGVPVEQVARAAGTIPYELICGVSQRVHLDVR